MSTTTALSASSSVTTPSSGAASRPVTMPVSAIDSAWTMAHSHSRLTMSGLVLLRLGVLEPGVDQRMAQSGGRREEPDQAVVPGGVDDRGGHVGEDHADQVERREQHAEAFAQTPGPGEELQQQRRHHDDVGPDEGRPDVAQHHRLPQMGVEVLHPGQHGTEQRRPDGQLHRGQPPAEGHTEGDPDDEDRDPGGQAGDGLGARPGVEDPLEEEDGHVAGRPDAGPEQERPGDQDLGVGAGQDVAQLVAWPAGPGPCGRPGRPGPPRGPRGPAAGRRPR